MYKWHTMTDVTLPLSVDLHPYIVIKQTLDDRPDTKIINTVSMYWQVRLCCAWVRRSESAGIVSIISSCRGTIITDSIVHPVFFASKHGLSGFKTKLLQPLSDENIRVTGLYPPDFELTGLDTLADSQARMGNVFWRGEPPGKRFVLYWLNRVVAL